MIINNKGSRRSRLGTTSVELAICLPIFFLVVFANIELGRGLMAQQIVLNAAREGARACIVGGLSEAETIDLVKEYASANALPGITVTVVPDPLVAELGDPITVQASIDYDDVRMFVPKYFVNAQLVGRSTMRKERQN